MLHRGSLADADLTYGELGAHVMRHEISVEGPLRENYLVGLLDTDDTDLGDRDRMADIPLRFLSSHRLTIPQR